MNVSRCAAAEIAGLRSGDEGARVVFGGSSPQDALIERRDGLALTCRPSAAVRLISGTHHLNIIHVPAGDRLSMTGADDALAVHADDLSTPKR